MSSLNLYPESLSQSHSSSSQDSNPSGESQENTHSTEWLVKHLNHRLKQDTIKILMLGDVVGKPGRKVVKEMVPKLKTALNLDFVTINGENLAGGFGITQKTYAEMLACGVEAVTMGNHWSDKPDVHAIRSESAKLVLPQNVLNVAHIEKIPQFEIRNGLKKILILNLMGNFAMKDSYGDLFAFIDRNLADLKSKVRSGQYLLLADIHAEASSEKQAAAWILDGIASMLIGTHTHCPTSDERITPKGTAFLTDVGMTGPYRSIIGMDIERTLCRYMPPKISKALEVADHDIWFCGFLGEFDPITHKAIGAHRLQYRSENKRWQCHSLE